MQFIHAPLCGRWSDRAGRRPVILYGLLASAVAYVALALADSLAFIFAARILGGIAGGNIPTAQAYIADVTTPENRARAWAWWVRRSVSASFSVRRSVASSRGSDTRRRCGSPQRCALPTFSPPWVSLPESRHGSADRQTLGRLDLARRASRHPGLLMLLVVFFFVSTAFSGFEATFALFTERRFGFTAETIGYIFAFIGVVLATINGLVVGRVVPIVGERRIIPRHRPYRCRPAAGARGSQRAGAVRGGGVIAVGMGFNNPTLTSAISRCSDPGEQGGMLGLAQSLAALGRIAGPAWGGFLFERLGSTMPYVSAASISCSRAAPGDCGSAPVPSGLDIDEKAGLRASGNGPRIVL